jgi:hypothetical protein
MPNLPISQLPTASALTGPELFATVQGGITKQTTFNNIFDGISGSVVLYSQTGSFVTNSQTSSFVTNSQTSSFVTTSSFNTYTGSIQSYYLSAYHTASIPLAVTNAVYSMSFSTTDFANGVSISGSSKTQIKITNTGIYDLQFSAQLSKTNNSNNTVYIWLAKNGNNVDDSNTGVTLGGGSNDSSVAAWNFYLSASAGDYYELRMAGTDNNAVVLYNETPTLGPAVPSVILTVGRIA